jgi:hypothetical protein
VLGESCFSGSGFESITFEGESRLKQIEESCFTCSSLKSICIPRDVEILDKSRFLMCWQLESITFENESQLRRIEELCFAYGSLKSICIPRNVDFINGPAFTNSRCTYIAVDPNNLRYSIDQDFLIDRIDMALIRYFGSSSRVYIWNEIQILGESCFCYCKELVSITFADETRLTRIEKSCFSNCSLKSIVIPYG